jgi:DnaJ-class molecular chaperone
VAEDYYIILGVPADATDDQIRSAYRSKAKRLHPDHFEGSSAPFRAVQEAYEVLRDPSRRRTYDDLLARERSTQQTIRGVRPEPVRRHHVPAEPLVPSRRSAAPQSPFLDPLFGSPVEEFLGHAGGTHTQRRARPAQEIHYQVSLSREQALRGGRIQLRLLLELRCPACGGRGDDRFFECLRCSGRGVVVDERPVEVTFPARVADGSTGRVPLDRLGMPGAVLTLHFHVDPR